MGWLGCACRALKKVAPKISGLACPSSCPAVAPVPNSTPFEKVYVVLDGEMTVIAGGRETVLGRYDSCTIPAGEIREIVNRRNDICTMLVVIPYPPGVKQ